MRPFEQNAVSRVVWPWTHEEPPEPPSRVKPVVFALVGWSVAALLFFRFHHRVMPAIVVVLSTLTFVGGVWSPPLYRGIEQALLLIGRGIGRVLTYLLLVPFFYLVFPLAHLGLALRGKDPMDRTFPSRKDSCWVDRARKEDRNALRRQG